jgi:hypothetical protein
MRDILPSEKSEGIAVRQQANELTGAAVGPTAADIGCSGSGR